MRIGDTQPYRKIELDLHEEGQGIWRWAYYPKVGEGVVKRGQVKGTRKIAIAAAKAAIDEWLGSKASD